MSSWEKRPIEIANLFNPSFCSLIIYEAVKGYTQESGKGMPYPLLFLLLPIILHKKSREELPRSIATKFHVWLEQHQHLKIDFTIRTRKMVSYTKEGLIFGMQMGILQFDEEGRALNQDALKNSKNEFSPEIIECYRRSRFLGRWLSTAGDTTTIYMMWGICP